MSADYRLIQEVNKKYITLNDEVVAREKQLLTCFLDIIVAEMRRQSPLFNKLFKGIYYSGSSYDGLQVSSCMKNDFDLNIKFGFPTSKVKIDCLEQHPKRINFANLRLQVTTDTLKEEERAIVDKVLNCVSPEKMFKILQYAGDKALTALNWQVVVNNQEYKVGRSIGAPYCITISGADGLKISIDIVPSIEFRLSDLPEDGNVRNRIQEIQRILNNHEDVGFMAICLWLADKEKFEIDFHELERKVLYKRGCIKTVIRLLKLIRNKKGGPMNKTWSHLIKTIVMHEVLANPSMDWNERDIVTIFIRVLGKWEEKFKNKRVTDLFFEEMNLMNRIDRCDQAVLNTTEHLGELLRRYKQDGMKRVFTSKEYPQAYESYVTDPETYPETYPRQADSNSESDTAQTTGLLVAGAAAVGLIAGVAALLSYFFTTPPKEEGGKKSGKR